MPLVHLWFHGLATKSVLVAAHSPLDDKLPSAAALFPCTSELGEFVNGISTSHIPISKSRPLSSSVATAVNPSHSAPLSTYHSPLNANTAMQAVISLCTFIGTSSTSSLIVCMAPALTIAVLFFSELAARFRKVEMA